MGEERRRTRFFPFSKRREKHTKKNVKKGETQTFSTKTMTPTSGILQHAQAFPDGRPSASVASAAAASVVKRGLSAFSWSIRNSRADVRSATPVQDPREVRNETVVARTEPRRWPRGLDGINFRDGDSRWTGCRRVPFGYYRGVEWLLFVLCIGVHG